MKRQGFIVFAGDQPRDSGPAFGFDCPLLVGVMFFPSFPFVGVMLFPSFVLGNASGDGSTFFVSLFLFSPLLSSPSPSFLVSLPLFSSPSPSLFHLFFLSFCTLSFPLSFSLLRLFFFFEGTACTVYFRDVRNDTTACNQLYLYWSKERFSFLSPEFVHYDVCNFLVHSLAELSETYDKIINKHTVRRPKIDNTLFKITTRGLLIKTLKVLSIPSMRYNFSLIRLEFVITRSDDVRYDVGAFLVGPLFSMCWILPCWQELF